MAYHYALLGVLLYLSPIFNYEIGRYSECTKGPGDWCTNLSLAQKCNAVQHCIDVWKYQIPPNKTYESECQFCIYLLKDLKTIEDQKYAENKIIQACSLSSDSDYTNKCLGLVNYLPTLKTILSNDLNEYWVCESLQHCKIPESDAISHVNLLDNIKPDTVTFNVNDVLGPLIGGLHDSQDVKDDSKYMNQMRKTWFDLVETNNIYKPEKNDETILESLRKEALLSGIKDENLCEMCKRGVVGVENLLENRTFQDDLVDYLSKFCVAIPNTEERFMCKEGMKKVLPDILKVIDTDIRKSDVCGKAQICSPHIIRKLKNQGTNRTNLCNDCKKMIDQVRNFVDKTEDHVMDGARHICQSFPKSIQEKCSAFIRNYIPAIYESINMLFNPVQTCQAVGICPSDYETLNIDEKLPSVFLTLNENTGTHGPLNSFKTPVNEMRMSDAVELAKRFLVHGAPFFLPQKLHKHVDDPLVHLNDEDDLKKLFDDIPRYIRNTKIGRPDVTEIDEMAGGKTPNQAECKICNIIVTELLKMLGENRTRENIIDAIKTGCNHLPSHFQTECLDFVNTYTEALIILLQNNANSTEICNAFDFCKVPAITNFDGLIGHHSGSLGGLSSSSLFENNASPTVYRAPYKNFDYCPICHIAVAWIGQKIGKNATDQELLAFAEKFCHDLPHVWVDRCLNYIDAYGIQALRIISDYMDPEIVCQQLGMCQSQRLDILFSRSEIMKQNEIDHQRVLNRRRNAIRPKSIGEKHLLGSEECSIGPGFWCSSKANMIKCQAEKFCATYKKE